MTQIKFSAILILTIILISSCGMGKEFAKKKNLRAYDQEITVDDHTSIIENIIPAVSEPREALRLIDDKIETTLITTDFETQSNNNNLVESELVQETVDTELSENNIQSEMNPPIEIKLKQSHREAQLCRDKKSCHQQKIGPIIIAIVTGVGILGFLVWAIATNT